MAERHYTGFLGKHAIATVACGALFVCGLSGCKDSEKNRASSTQAETPVAAQPGPGSFSLGSILRGLEGASTDVQDAVRPHADAVQAKTREELDKLFRWEYRVIELPSGVDATTLQSQLSLLGEENWEVIDMSAAGQVTRIVCKRRPDSAIGYLKYIPGF